MRRRRLLAASAAAGLWVASVATAFAGEVLLTVTGRSGKDVTRFDEARLRALDWREIVTYTTWTRGPQRFAGPTLASVLAQSGATGRDVQAIALNDYEVVIPASDARLGVIVAVEHGGRPMPVREKGPLWIIYPQSEEEAQARANDFRMVWQLCKLVVR